MTSNRTMPPDIAGNPIYSTVWNRLYRKNKNFLAINVGQTGSGKSWGALRIAYDMDRNYKDRHRFSMEKVVFSPSQFLALVRKGLPVGSFIVWDEAGVGLSSREWYSKVNRFLVKVLQTFRFQQLGVIFTTPALNNIDKQARQLFHSIITYSGTVSNNYSNAVFKWIDYDSMGDKFYYKYPRVFTGGVSNILRSIDVAKPPDAFIEEYEAVKEKQLHDWYDNYEAELKVMEATLGEEKKKGQSKTKQRAEIILKKGLGNFVDLNKQEKGKQDLDSSEIAVELDVSAPLAIDVKKYIMRRIKLGELAFPEV